MRGDKLAQRLSGDGHAGRVDEAALVELVHHGVDAARAVKVIHVMVAVGAYVAEVRRLAADLVKLLKRQLQAKLVCDGRQMQRRVRGAGDGHVHADRVLKRLLGEYVAGADVLHDHAHGVHARALCQRQSLAVVGGDSAVAGQRHASASARQFMEFAVNMPEQEPQPGQQCWVSSSCSSGVMSPLCTLPTVSMHAL